MIEEPVDQKETVLKSAGPLEHAASRAAIEAKSIVASRSLTVKSTFLSVVKCTRVKRAQFEDFKLPQQNARTWGAFNLAKIFGFEISVTLRVEKFSSSRSELSLSLVDQQRYDGIGKQQQGIEVPSKDGRLFLKFSD